MKQILNYLKFLHGDVFKLLPLKEEELSGSGANTSGYLASLIISTKGALINYPELGDQKKYLYLLNNLQYISQNETTFEEFRKIILDSRRNVADLYVTYGGNEDELRRVCAVSALDRKTKRH